MILFYRSLLGISFGILFLCIGLEFISFEKFPTEWQEARKYDGNGSFFLNVLNEVDIRQCLFGETKSKSVIASLIFVSLFLLLDIGLYIYGLIGLVFFWKYSREAFVFSIASSLASSFWLGLSVSYPYEQFYYYCSGSK